MWKEDGSRNLEKMLFWVRKIHKNKNLDEFKMPSRNMTVIEFLFIDVILFIFLILIIILIFIRYLCSFCRKKEKIE